VPGFPIRTSSDPRSVDSSPRHIAASHVLHRLLMPRHPPCALKHLQTQKNTQQKTLQKIQRSCLDARNHYPTLKHHTPPPRRGDSTRTTRVLSQGPIVCPAIPTPHHKRRGKIVVAHPVRATTAAHPFTAHTPHRCGAFFVVLLRKEVIQPHLPVRLPCYDFVPIADPTFDSSPHKG
jgi:hypothetical protein